MIKGEKVGLRALEVEDLKLLRDWRNIDDLRKNFREVRELNLENQMAWFKKLSISSNDYMFGIVDLKSNELIGACGLLYINQIIKSADFSFYIGKDEIYVDDELGLSREAAKLLIEYGFNRLNLNKIWMELYEYDLKKIKFFTEEFNFQIDGIFRQNCFYDGRFYDSKLLSILRSEYGE